MKKKLLIALIAITAAICCVFGFAACGNNDGNKENDKTEQSGNNQTPENGGNGNVTEHTHILTLVEDTAATCIRDGNNAYYSCNECDKWFSDENGENEISNKAEYILKHSGHKFTNGVCSVCSTHEPTKGLKYTLSSDGTYYTCDGFEATAVATVYVADLYNDKLVTAVGDNAFNGCTSLTSVTIYDSVASIGNYAFNGCSNLSSVTIPEGVTFIGSGAFRYCTSLTGITLPVSINTIESGAFFDCSKLTNLTFNGTKAEWNLISQVKYSWNYNTGISTIHCTDGDIEKD